MKRHSEQCQGCGAIRPLIELRERLHESTVSVRVLCRYCADRIRNHPDARYLNPWPAYLISEMGPKRIVAAPAD